MTKVLGATSDFPRSAPVWGPTGENLAIFRLFLLFYSSSIKLFLVHLLSARNGACRCSSAASISTLLPLDCK